MAGHFDHLVNLFSKRFGQLDDLIRKIIHLEASNQELEIHLAVTKKYFAVTKRYFAVTKKICGHKKDLRSQKDDSVKEARGNKRFLLHLWIIVR